MGQSYLTCVHVMLHAAVSTVRLHVTRLQQKIWTNITWAAFMTEDVDPKQVNNHLSSCAPQVRDMEY